MNELKKYDTSGTSVTVVPKDSVIREGYNDQSVEIVRGGIRFDSYISQVRPGDCFCLVSRPNMWFGCLSPIRRDYFRSELNPTFSMAGLEIMQAPPRVEPTAPAIQEKPKAKALPRPADYDDVDFDDV